MSDLKSSHSKIKPKLFNCIKENKKFSIVNAEDGNKYNLEDVLLSINNIIKQDKKLIFLYLDSSLISLSYYLTFLNSNHTIVLLSNTLEDSLKEKLEKEYHPYAIFDKSRKNIKNFSSKSLNNKFLKTFLYLNNNNKDFKINSNCKILLSTSGTTGSTKFVKLSEENIFQNTLSIINYLPINNDDITPLNLPIYYSYGLSIFNSNAMKGGKIICGLPVVLDNRFWEYLNLYKFTSIAGVPYTYEVLSLIGFLKKDYPSLRYITQAGGHLSKNIKMAFYEYCTSYNIKFFVMYGQTEAAPRISYVPPDKLRDKLNSIGIPIKNGKLDIDIETGELLYSGPNIFGGYATKKADLDKWEDISLLKTGDLATKDNDGYFYIIGRLKRFVKIFGNRINLDELENFLKKLISRSFICCLGIQDKFILIAHNFKNIDETEIKEQLFKIFKLHSSALVIKYFEDLPKTENGKISYKKIEELYLSK